MRDSHALGPRERWKGPENRPLPKEDSATGEVTSAKKGVLSGQTVGFAAYGEDSQR